MEKDLSNKVDSKIPKDILDKICKNNIASQELDNHLNSIFEEAFAIVPKSINYIVGVINPNNLEEEIPLYGFERNLDKKPFLGIFGKLKQGSEEFINQCYANGNIAMSIYRNERKEIWLY